MVSYIAHTDAAEASLRTAEYRNAKSITLLYNSLL